MPVAERGVLQVISTARTESVMEAHTAPRPRGTGIGIGAGTGAGLGIVAALLLGGDIALGIAFGAGFGVLVGLLTETVVAVRDQA
jgi:hypothetical protein